MRKIVMVAMFALAFGGSAFAAEEKKSLPIQECSTMWKAHKASAGYTDPGKGNRMAAWNEFRKAKCSKSREG